MSAAARYDLYSDLRSLHADYGQFLFIIIAKAPLQ